MEDFEAEFTVEPREDFNFVFEFNIKSTEVDWGRITGTLDDQTDLADALDTLDSQIAGNHQEITNIHNTIQGYGDIVSYNAADFATKNQGLLAESALQPNNNISLLNNNAGYITNSALNGYATQQWAQQQASSLYASMQTWVRNQGYTSNVGTVTSVNNTQPDANGNVTIQTGGTVDQTFDGSSTNAQSGVAIEGELANYVKGQNGNITISNTGSMCSIGYADANTGNQHLMQIGHTTEGINGVLFGSLDMTTSNAYMTVLIPNGFILGDMVNNQTATLTVSNNNLAVNGKEIATKDDINALIARIAALEANNGGNS